MRTKNLIPIKNSKRTNLYYKNEFFTETGYMEREREEYYTDVDNIDSADNIDSDDKIDSDDDIATKDGSGKKCIILHGF
jgi:hypothetical protein